MPMTEQSTFTIAYHIHQTTMSTTKERIAVAMGMVHRPTSRNAHGINVLELQQAYNKMNMRNGKLTEAVGGVVCGGGAKNKRRAYKKNLPPTDENNVAMANNKIDTSIYSDHPLRPILCYR